MEKGKKVMTKMKLKNQLVEVVHWDEYHAVSFQDVIATLSKRDSAIEESTTYYQADEQVVLS